MICQKCGKENDDGALFCEGCGSKLITERICPSCGEKNGRNALYCKGCGTKLFNELNEEKREKTKTENTFILNYNKIVSIILLCFAIVLLLMNFGSCFSNFLSYKLDMKNLTSNYLPEKKTISTGFLNAFEIMKGKEELTTGEKINAVLTICILIVPIIGTFVAMLSGMGIAIYQGTTKKKIPNIKKQLAISLGFLLCGVLMMGLFQMQNYKGYSNYIETSCTEKIRYGGFVITVVSLCFSYMILDAIHHLVLNILRKNKNEILKSIFNLAISSIMVVLLLAISMRIVTIRVDEAYLHIKNSYSVGNLFIDFYDLNDSLDYGLFGTMLSYSMLLFFLSVASIILMVVFFVKRTSQLDKKNYKSSIVSGITMVVLSIVALFIIILIKNELSKKILEVSTYNSGLKELLKVNLGAGSILNVVFSILLLIIEIVEKLLIQKEENE